MTKPASANSSVSTVSGMRVVVMPAENEKDLTEIPTEVQEALEFRMVDSMDEVLSIALERLPEGVENLADHDGQGEGDDRPVAH